MFKLMFNPACTESDKKSFSAPHDLNPHRKPISARAGIHLSLWVQISPRKLGFRHPD